MSKKYTRWKDWEKEFVRNNCKEMTDSEIAEHIGRTKGAVNGFRMRNNIKTGRTGYFDKGHEPHNKGKSADEYLSEEAKQAMAKTQFKEGHKPHNTKWDGAISVRQDSQTGIKYLYYRVSEGNWRLYHRKVYEDNNDNLPEDKIVIFKDGNQFNIDPENLEAITRAEHARRNRNYEKAMQTMIEQGNHPSIHLTDRWVAGRIAHNDEELKKYLLEERTDIISIARANYKLKRQINEYS